MGSLKKIGKTISRVNAGIVTGGLSELAGYKGGNPFKTEYDTQSQVPLETPEQSAARKMLFDFAKQGKFGNFEAGQNLGLGLGDFNMTGAEKTGMSSLQSLLSSGIPDQFKLGDAALQDILATSPSAIDAQFEPFKAIANREIQGQMDSVKRNAAFGGNLFSTGTYRNLNDVGARGAETLTGQLANLTNNALERRLRAIPLAYQAGGAVEDLNRGRISDAFQYGGIERNLNDARIKAGDAEILRRRNELTMPIQAAHTVLGSNPNYGIPEIKTPKPNPFMDLLNLAVKGGSAYLGAGGLG